MQMRLYSELLHTRYSCELLYSCVFQYMEEAMNCSIGSGQNYFSLSCSIFFFSLRNTYSFVHAILSISVLFVSSVSMLLALLAKTSCGWSFMETTQPRICLSTETVWALCVSIIFAEHSFRGNPQNMQCLNRTEIDSALPHCPR